MSTFTFALLLCGSPKSTAAPLGALASTTDLYSLDCPTVRLPDLERLPLLPANQHPLLVLSTVRNHTHLTYLEDLLAHDGIDSVTVWAEPHLPTDLTAPFHPSELQFTTHLPQSTPSSAPHRLDPQRLIQAVRTAGRLRASKCVHIEVPLGELTLVVPSPAQKTDADTSLAEAKALGALYCRHYNEEIPRECSRCGTPGALDQACLACGQSPRLRSQVLHADEQGYYAADFGSDSLPPNVTARFICRPT